jgi:hypothetical protein
VALAEITIDLARKVGAQYDANRETPPVIDDAFHRAIWRVYLATRNARTAQALNDTAARHRR